MLNISHLLLAKPWKRQVVSFQTNNALMSVILLTRRSYARKSFLEISGVGLVPWVGLVPSHPTKMGKGISALPLI